MGDRKLLERLEKVETSSKWFEVYKLPGEVYAIMEPRHIQEAISYLIIGANRALLIDTGAAVDNIKNVVDSITDKEVVVVNTHIHFDHVGDNSLFKEVHVYNDAHAIDRLKRGYNKYELAPMSKMEWFEDGYMPDDYDPENYVIQPSNPKPVEDGVIFDLGERSIKVIHTPGHSPDSIMLLDIEQKALYTGDSYYPGHLYAFFEGDFFGQSDLETFADTMEKISRMADDLISIHPSHNDPTANPQMLKKVAAALKKLVDRDIAPGKLLKGDLSVASLPNKGEEVEGYVIPEELYIYDFDEFKIISKKRHA